MNELLKLQNNCLNAAVLDMYEQEINGISGAILTKEPYHILQQKVIIYFPSLTDEELHTLLKFCGVKQTKLYDYSIYYEHSRAFTTDVLYIPDNSKLGRSAKAAKG